VLEAAQQLAACSHKVKNLKLEAQGIRAAELEGLGDSLVTLPYVTWLTLALQYTPARTRRPQQQQRQQQQQAAAGQAAAGLNTAESAAQAQPQASAAAPYAAVAAAGGPAGGASADNTPPPPPAAGGAPGAPGGPGARFDNWFEPAAKLSYKLLNGLPATVLELRIRPYALF
jgi:predicted lipid-binding transport protein (Tim44 family)